MNNNYLLKFKHIPFARRIYRFVKQKNVKTPTWEESLIKYAEWSVKPLPEEYLSLIIDISRRFNKFSKIYPFDKILDIGCGTDKIGGMSYKELFGWDDSDNPNWRGIDPLKGRATDIGKAEDMYMYQNDSFDKIQISTTLDHFKDWKIALKECARVMKQEGEINIWFTNTEMKDNAHPVRVTWDELQSFVIKKLKMTYQAQIEPWNNSDKAMTVFFKIRHVKL